MASLARTATNHGRGRKGYLQSGLKAVAHSFALDNSGFANPATRATPASVVAVIGDVPSRPALGAYLVRSVWSRAGSCAPIAAAGAGRRLPGSASFLRARPSSARIRPRRRRRGIVPESPASYPGPSAAIVVFSPRVRAGFSRRTADPSPNPYVLLLTCLIGAVFSEQVWDWAQRKLSDNLASDSKPKAPPTDSSPPTVAPAKN